MSLSDGFEGRKEPAESVNRLLVVGFYLVNLGFVSFASKTGSGVAGPTESVEALARRLGLVLVVLGALHLGNMLPLGRMHRRHTAPQRTEPPVRPDGVPPVSPYAAPTG